MNSNVVYLTNLSTVLSILPKIFYYILVKYRIIQIKQEYSKGLGVLEWQLQETKFTALLGL